MTSKSAREFELVRDFKDGHMKQALKLSCGKCGKTELLGNSSGRVLPFGVAEDKAKQMGWLIGGGPLADRCPKCVSHITKKPSPELKIVSQVNETVPVAEAPREMGRSDRRIINDKLDEVYGDERYKTPWTDAAVAKDLGVPRVWVSTVRDEFFGPEGGNPEFDDFLAQAAPVIAEMKNLHRSLTGQIDQYKAITGRIEGIEKLAKKVEREIGR